MSHVRTQIRQAVKALLAAQAGGNVFVGRTAPTGTEVMPCLLIYTTDEPTTDGTIGMGSVLQERTLTLRIEARRQDTDDEALLDGLDEMARQVEVSLLTPGALGDLAKAIELVSTSTQTMAANEARSGQSEMTFQILYHTTAGEPDTAV